MMTGNKKIKRALVGTAVVASMIGAYLGVMAALKKSPVLNFDVVEPGRLMRTAQPRVGDLDDILEERGLGTIICLRGKGEPGPRRWAREHGVKMVMLKMSADREPDPGQIGLFFDIMRGDTITLEDYGDVKIRTIGVDGDGARLPFPVLVHCEGGADRTGVMVALYRMAFQGWELDRAKKEMILHGHIPIMHPRQFEFLEEVEPQLTRRYGSRKAPQRQPDEIK
jgi:protein tyrosine/serine phosphatase